jgi:hypothetical protein
MQRAALGYPNDRRETIAATDLGWVGGEGKIPSRFGSGSWRLGGRLVGGHGQRGMGDHGKRNKWFFEHRSASQRVDRGDERRAQANHHEADFPAAVAGETAKRESAEEKHEKGDAAGHR